MASLLRIARMQSIRWNPVVGKDKHWIRPGKPWPSLFRSGTSIGTIWEPRRLFWPKTSWRLDVLTRRRSHRCGSPVSPGRGLEFLERSAQRQRHDFDLLGPMFFIDTTPLYFLLFLHWPDIMKIDNVTELHSYLEKFALLP
jgi:hypothetical protein